MEKKSLKSHKKLNSNDFIKLKNEFLLYTILEKNDKYSNKILNEYGFILPKEELFKKMLQIFYAKDYLLVCSEEDKERWEKFINPVKNFENDMYLLYKNFLEFLYTTKIGLLCRKNNLFIKSEEEQNTLKSIYNNIISEWLNFIKLFISTIEDSETNLKNASEENEKDLKTATTKDKMRYCREMKCGLDGLLDILARYKEIYIDLYNNFTF